MPFQPIAARYQGPSIEQHVLEYWKTQHIFEKTLQATEGKPLFTFNEGPPTANGKPGLHHVLARTFKDVYPRYRTMRGFHCPRKAGWDTHGLPVEHEIEKELGIFDKKVLEAEVGIAEFNRRCRESVMRYIKDWQHLTERMGFWVDLENAYYTLDNDYIESVWYLLRTIWDKGLIYQGYRVAPYDPRIGATLSSHEVALGYKEVQDPSVFVRFPLKDQPNTAFLAWTTTPWTLPAHVALAVHPNLSYAFVKIEDSGGDSGDTLIVAEMLVEKVMAGAPYQVEKVLLGTELVGAQYQRPFDWLPEQTGMCQVVEETFVTAEDGTGIVHIAPAYGADDLAASKRHDLPVLHCVGLDGCFLPEVGEVSGLFFKDADPHLIESMKKLNVLFREEQITHSYPHGWRTGDPLIYYAKEGWYIRTSALRERMSALNKEINWVPEHIQEGRFGNWLANNQDWALSRERFWGTPLPVWTDGHGEQMCIGSVAELEALCGKSLKGVDLHRPAIDDITFTHPKSGKLMRRVPEVIDCWFDSGAMSYAQWHYPFENQAQFVKHFPADYICEAIDQTRGWFYTLHAIAALVSDSVAFRNVICLSHIVDANGRKMSKSLGNVMNPQEVFDQYGADSLRWHFLARVPPQGQKRISMEIINTVASGFMNTYWNCYAFLVTYANLDQAKPWQAVSASEREPIDLWLLAALQDVIETATAAMDRYDTKAAGAAIEQFIDQLSNWYIRLNRRRFWKSGLATDKNAAYCTLYQSLVVINRMLAPFMPFLSETVHQNLAGYCFGEHANTPSQGQDRAQSLPSVHMTDWPTVDPQWVNPSLLQENRVAQQIVSLGRSARASSGHRIRQPLSKVLIKAPTSSMQQDVLAWQNLILSELNVKQIDFIAEESGLIVYKLKPNLPELGKRYGKLIPQLRQSFANPEICAEILPSILTAKPFTLAVGSETLHLKPEDVLVETHSHEGYACAQEGGWLVALDTTLTEDLLAEGLFREVLRSVQEERKQQGLEIADRIELHIQGSEALHQTLNEYRTTLMAETLAAHCELTTLSQDTADSPRTHQLDQHRWMIELKAVTTE